MLLKWRHGSFVKVVNNTVGVTIKMVGVTMTQDDDTRVAFAFVCSDELP